MAKIRFERRSFATELLTYLQGRGWNDVTEIREQFIKDIPLTLPAVGVHFIPSRIKELQLGRNAPTYTRAIQVDVYMESEQRSEAIIDDIGDFMDEISIAVKDTSSNIIAYMVSETDSILLDNPPLQATSPELIRWRGVASCIYEVHYLD